MMRLLLSAVCALLLWGATAQAATTWNSSDCESVITLSGGNLTMSRSGNSNWVSCRATSNFVGQCHFEIANNVNGSLTPDDVRFGVLNSSQNLTASLYYPGQGTDGVGFSTAGTTFQAGGLVIPVLAKQTAAIELDLPNKKLWIETPVAIWNGGSFYEQAGFVTLSNANLTATRSSGTGNWTGGTAVSDYGTGKLHYEIKVTGTPSSNIYVGAANNSVAFYSNLTFPGSNTADGFGYEDTGTTSGFGGITMPSIAANNVIAVEIDFGAGLAWMQNSSNGKWNNDVLANQNPATDTGGVNIASMGKLYPSVAFFGTGVSAVLNTQGTGTAFAVTPSSGYSAWDTQSALWNNDVLANQNPATDTGGISISGITGSIYPAAGLFAGFTATAQFDIGAGFSLPVSSGYHDMDTAGCNTVIVPTICQRSMRGYGC